MEEASNKATIFKNISWQVVAETVFKLLGFVFFLVFTRQLGKTVLGFYTYIFSVLSLINVVWDLGISSFFSRKWVTEDSEYKKDIALIGTARVIIVLVSLVFLIPYIAQFERTIWIEFLLGTLIYVVDLFKALPAIYFQAKNRFDKVFYINLLDRGAGYGLAIAAIYAGYNLKAVLACLLLAKIIVVIYGNYLKPSFAFGKLHWAEFRLLLQKSAPLFLVGLFGSLYFRIDSVMIKSFLGFNHLGIYSAAYRLIDTGTVVSSILTSSVFPILVSMQKDLVALPRLLTKNIKYFAAIAGFMAICGIFKANEVILFLFAENFTESGPVLSFLAVSLVFIFLNGLLLIQMIASHQERYLLYTFIAMAILNVALNFYFIPTYGLKGAAITTIISEVLNFILLYRKLPVKISYGWVPGWIIALGTAGLLLYYVPMHWVPVVAISGIVYLLFLLVFKVLDVSDLPLKPKTS